MKNFIVYKSSAGSGKTYNLALNYISLSLGNGHFKKDYFRKILAITFTNKAAKEMKERILHYLFNLSKENDVDNILNEIKLKTQLSEDLIFKFSKELYSYIIHNYSDLGIQTIDKFTYKLVKSFSRDLGVNSDFELELDSQKIIQPVVASLLNKISDDNKFFSDVLVDFALQKIDDGNSYNIQNDLEEFCKHFFIEDSQNKLNHNSFSIKESKEIKDNLFSKKKSCKVKIDDLQKEVISFFSKNNLTENHFLRGTYYNLFYKKLSSSNYKDWIPSSSLLNNIENDIWYKKNLEDNFKIKIDSLKENLVNYIKELLDLTKDYITYNSILNKIYPTIIINELLKQIETFKKENNIEHISAFNRKIHHLVTTQVSSFIFERLGERYNHFLIDEFQDTSILQWQNFLPLITDALDFGKSIVVGDGKQSIYRWRSGEVEQFLNLPFIYKGNNLSYFSEWQAKLNNHYFEKNLSENFRSKKNIIQFNNEFFSSSKEILSQDYIKIYDNSQQTFSFSKEGGYVKIDLFDQLVFEENMLQQIIFEINDFVEKRNYNFNDIAILCNTHKEIEMIANFLSSKNIPIVSNEGLLISKSPKVSLIISILKFLRNPQDNIVMASVLTNLQSQKDKSHNLHDLFLKLRQKKPFFKILKELGFEINFNKISENSLFEIVNEIIICFKISKDIYVDFFIDLVHTFTLKKLSSISGFLDYWSEIINKKSIVISEDVNAVRLMTIHKSKGLAFPIVFIPFDWKSSPKKEMWVENSTALSNKLRYSLINQNKLISNSHFAEQYDKEQSLNVLDNLNKLYVACTRAKDALFIFSPKTEKTTTNKFNMNSFLNFYSKKYPFVIGKKEQSGLLNTKSKNILFKKNINVKNWRKSLVLKNTSSELWDTQFPKEKKDWGKLLHYTLSKIIYKDQKNSIINEVYNQGYCDIIQRDRLTKEIESLFQSKEINYFFTDEWEVKTEREILLPNGKTYIPDRILFKEDKLVVIDYKTGQVDDSHKEQIVKYSNALKQMGYDNVNMYLIYTNQTKKVHKV